MVLSNFPTVIESIFHFAVKLSPVTSNAYEETANINKNPKKYFFIFSPCYELFNFKNIVTLFYSHSIVTLSKTSIK
jgi:hypothetical protein